MKAMIFAAGKGTRLRPWTDSHPKALVPVGGVPMLRRVIERLRSQGFDDIVVNVHHFAEQIIGYLNSRDFGVRIRISDERGCLLDTGGGVLKASDLLFETSGPVLIHNVDILSDADLKGLMEAHIASGAQATLLVSDRHSSRKLIVDAQSRLCGWHNLGSGEYRPVGFVAAPGSKEVAFSGIHVISDEIIARMKEKEYPEIFPIMDFYLNECSECDFSVHDCGGSLHLIDIGKPDTLEQANALFR